MTCHFCRILVDFSFLHIAALQKLYLKYLVTDIHLFVQGLLLERTVLLLIMFVKIWINTLLFKSHMFTKNARVLYTCTPHNNDFIAQNIETYWFCQLNLYWSRIIFNLMVCCSVFLIQMMVWLRVQEYADLFMGHLED